MKLQDNLYTILSQQEEAGLAAFQLRIHPEWPIYKAHFPGHPITPGVCIVQMIGELLGDRCGRRLSLSKIVNLKFVAPISPVDTPDIEISFTLVDDTATACKAKGTITSGEQLLTQFSLVFNG